MDLVDLITARRLYDALLFTVDLAKKSEHEEIDVEALIAAYRLCCTKDADPYLLDMLKGGILKILHSATQKNVQVEDLLKVAEILSEDGNPAAVHTHFVEYLSDFLYQVAVSMCSKGNTSFSYRCLSAIAALKVPVCVDYVLLENELKRSLQLQEDYTVFAGGEQKYMYPVQPAVNMKDSAPIRDRRLRVDILLEFSVVWCKVKSLYEALSKDPSFDCRLVAINIQEISIDSATQYPEFLAFLNERDIPFVPEVAYDLAERRPDVLIYTNPYDNHHPKFAVERIRQQGIRVVYLPYSIPFFIDSNNKWYLYDLPIHRHAWRVYVRSQREQRKYGRFCQSGNAHVMVAGGPLADYIAEQKALIKPDTRFKKTFLWGIDYGFVDGTATFGEYGERILQYFADHPWLGLIVRPHPLFPGAVIKQRVMSEETLHAFYAQCNALPNVSLDLCGDLTDSFCKSDALISEASSIQVEYLLMGRPIMRLKSRNAPDYRDYQDDDADMLALCDEGDSFDCIVRFIEMVVADEDPMRKEREAVLGKYFYRPTENAGENIKELLKDALRNV